MTEMETLRKKVADVVDNTEFLEWMNKKRWKFRFPMYQGAAYMQNPLEELELTVRSYNCLKRSGYQTVGDIVDNINGREDLLEVRNLGKRSADEIMMKLFLYQYAQLDPKRQERYRKRIVEMN